MPSDFKLYYNFIYKTKGHCIISKMVSRMMEMV